METATKIQRPCPLDFAERMANALKGTTSYTREQRLDALEVPEGWQLVRMGKDGEDSYFLAEGEGFRYRMSVMSLEGCAKLARDIKATAHPDKYLVTDYFRIIKSPTSVRTLGQVPSVTVKGWSRKYGGTAEIDRAFDLSNRFIQGEVCLKVNGAWLVRIWAGTYVDKATGMKPRRILFMAAYGCTPDGFNAKMEMYRFLTWDEVDTKHGPRTPEEAKAWRGHLWGVHETTGKTGAPEYQINRVIANSPLRNDGFRLDDYIGAVEVDNAVRACWKERRIGGGVEVVEVQSRQKLFGKQAWLEQIAGITLTCQADLDDYLSKNR